LIKRLKCDAYYLWQNKSSAIKISNRILDFKFTGYKKIALNTVQ